jgi:hypothetical protein
VPAVLGLKPHYARRDDGLNQSLLNMLHLVCSDDVALRSVEPKSGRSRKDVDAVAGTMYLKRRLQNEFKLVLKIPGADPRWRGDQMAAGVFVGELRDQFSR